MDGERPERLNGELGGNLEITGSWKQVSPLEPSEAQENKGDRVPEPRNQCYKQGPSIWAGIKEETWSSRVETMEDSLPKF